MLYDALVVVDMQTALLEAHPWDEAGVLERIQGLIAACRARGIPVVYVRHTDADLPENTDGWQIHPAIAPQSGEKVFDKRFNSAFRQTGLHGYLQAMHAKNLILCGMQTEYCFDATCKAAFELGYTSTVARGTVTTFDSAFAGGGDLTRWFEDKIWQGRYAQVWDIDEVLAEIEA